VAPTHVGPRISLTRPLLNYIHSSRPTELLARPLAILGTAALLVAASITDARRRRSRGAWAGPPTLSDDEEEREAGPTRAAGAGGAVWYGNWSGAAAVPAARPVSPRRSALLLAGRLLMAGLLGFSGWMQVGGHGAHWASSRRDRS
jgi:hypothetical protein